MFYFLHVLIDCNVWCFAIASYKCWFRFGNLDGATISTLKIRLVSRSNHGMRFANKSRTNDMNQISKIHIIVGDNLLVIKPLPTDREREKQKTVWKKKNNNNRKQTAMHSRERKKAFETFNYANALLLERNGFIFHRPMIFDFLTARTHALCWWSLRSIWRSNVSTLYHLLSVECEFFFYIFEYSMHPRMKL